MLHALGHNEHLAGSEANVAVPHLDHQAALEHEKEVVRVCMRVPDELTLDLDHHQIVTIELADGPRLPMFFERGELLSEVDCLHGLGRGARCPLTVRGRHQGSRASTIQSNRGAALVSNRCCTRVLHCASRSVTSVSTSSATSRAAVSCIASATIRTSAVSGR